nr:hypothetical protein B0A51_00775 [Rachicladosporium sp. CCFEE 5018]
MAMSTRDRAYYAHTATNDYFGFVPRARSSRSSHSDYPPTLPPPYDEISRRRTSARTSSNYSTARLETSFSRLRGPLPSTERRSTRTPSLSEVSLRNGETVAMREVAPTGRQLQFDSDQNQRLAHGSFASTVPYRVPMKILAWCYFETLKLFSWISNSGSGFAVLLRNDSGEVKAKGGARLARL